MKESVAISFCPDVTRSCATTNAASPEKKKKSFISSAERTRLIMPENQKTATGRNEHRVRDSLIKLQAHKKKD